MKSIYIASSCDLNFITSTFTDTMEIGTNVDILGSPYTLATKTTSAYAVTNIQPTDEENQITA
jgi:hypothetical protein